AREVSGAKRRRRRAPRERSVFERSGEPLAGAPQAQISRKRGATVVSRVGLEPTRLSLQIPSNPAKPLWTLPFPPRAKYSRTRRMGLPGIRTRTEPAQARRW